MHSCCILIALNFTGATEMKPTQKKPWDEEHIEFTKNANRVKLGDKWRFGFYQVVRDKELPQTKIKDNNLTEFLLPEDHVSLKLYFDNLRNYAICAAFIALGSIVWAKPPNLLPTALPELLAKICASTIWVMAGLLLILNCMQTWVILVETYSSIRAIQIAEYVFYRGESLYQVILSALHILGSWLLDVFFRICMLVFGISVIFIVLGFVYYSAISAPGIR